MATSSGRRRVPAGSWWPPRCRSPSSPGSPAISRWGVEPMSLRSPLGRVRGLGSAKDGTGHWWAQRPTALALIQLTLWLCISVVAISGADHPQAAARPALQLDAGLTTLLSDTPSVISTLAFPVVLYPSHS